MKRRTFIKSSVAAASLTTSTGLIGDVRSSDDYDTVVVGAGVFGAWSAWSLHQAGKKVLLIDKHSPANTLASSGGESRVTRSGYGQDELYAEWAHRSLHNWKALSTACRLPLFHPVGVLWVHKVGDPVVAASMNSLRKLQIPYETLDHKTTRRRYPVMQLAEDEAAFFEPRSGGLMARRAVQTLVAQAVAEGMAYRQGKARPIKISEGESGRLKRIYVEGNGKTESIVAEQFVMACGPWLDQACPDAMAERLFVTRQEVFYFDAGIDKTGKLPVWSAGDFYGFPDLEGRGFKVADDRHGIRVDPDSQDRRPGAEGLRMARDFLSLRFPSIADAPVIETRVCQYENSSNGDFVIDRHPGLSNVWVVGGGSGHGFKHGPALGSHVAALVNGETSTIDRFSLASKAKAQKREVH